MTRNEFIATTAAMNSVIVNADGEFQVPDSEAVDLACEHLPEGSLLICAAETCDNHLSRLVIVLARSQGVRLRPRKVPTRLGPVPTGIGTGFVFLAILPSGLRRKACGGAGGGKVPCALTYIAGFGSGHRNATRNAGVPDLAQRAKAAARKLARQRGRLA